jgi:hypothetical protein
VFVRRFWLVGAVIMAALLIMGVSVQAKTPAKRAAKKPTTVKETCKLSLTAQIPAGDTVITPGDPQGTQAGSVACGKLFGQGVQTDPYTATSSGDVDGTYKQYFATGTIHGVYDLTLTSQSAPTTTTFTAAGYTGTVSVAAGTGTYAGVKGKGTLTCSTSDSVHTSCTEHLKLKVPAAA